MPGMMFQGELKKNNSTVKVRLILFHFIDENKVHILFSPHIDISGSGYSLYDAKKSFEIALSDFFDYTIKKKTIKDLLKEYGWKFKENIKKPKEFKVPDIADVIAKNKHVSEILNNYPVQTIHKDYNVPAFV